MMIIPKTLLSQNKKIKASGKHVYNFGITARQTCPMAGICATGCYATQGAYAWSNVAQAFKNRTMLTRTELFVPAMIKALKSKRKLTHLRIHDSGDFYNAAYLDKWLEIINHFPDIQFYAYTKMVGMFKDYFKRGLIPDNFTVIYSYGGKQDALIDPEKDRHSKVFNSLEELQKAGYIDTTKYDLHAIGYSHKIGLVYHGANKKRWNA